MENKNMKKILIVDDERDILTSMKILIESMGIKVKTVDNGRKALNALKKEFFDLVLLDILMPGMSGKEVLEKIRKDSKLKKQKVAFLTVVRLGDVGKKEIKKLKPVDYIEKPVDIDSFKKKIKKILRE
jgi:two-component system, OmpR family, response regulator ChvI